MTNPTDYSQLKQQIGQWAKQAGFSQMRVSALPLAKRQSCQQQMQQWLQAGQHGEMAYLARDLDKRFDPASWVNGSTRVLSFAMNYLPPPSPQSAANAPNAAANALPQQGDWQAIEWQRLRSPQAAVISLYARGRDYHKLLRSRLAALAKQIHQHCPSTIVARACVDSAPVLEVQWAAQAGLGWRGKHTLLLNRESGSMFFLGELFTDLPLPVDAASSEHCGSCQRCLQICPTQAITAPYQLDARRCISYLTIEHRGSIATELRPLMGNRIYGCDDCQLVCPWNRYAQRSREADFLPRWNLHQASLVELMSWSELDFAERTQGSAIRRIGYAQWLRNLAIGLGNELAKSQAPLPILQALQQHAQHSNAIVREHVAWALAQRP